MLIWGMGWVWLVGYGQGCCGCMMVLVMVLMLGGVGRNYNKILYFPPILPVHKKLPQTSTQTPNQPKTKIIQVKNFILIMDLHLYSLPPCLYL